MCPQEFASFGILLPAQSGPAQNFNSPLEQSLSNWPARPKFKAIFYPNLSPRGRTPRTPKLLLHCPARKRACAETWQTYFNNSSNAFAAASDDAGFCPVTSIPSVSTNGAQSAPSAYSPPLALSMSSTRNGTTFVSCTPSSLAVGEARHLVISAMDCASSISSRSGLWPPG